MVEFLRNFLRDNRANFCGISTENSTETKPRNFLWKFHRKFSGSVSVEIPQKVPRFCVGLLGLCPDLLFTVQFFANPKYE